MDTTYSKRYVDNMNTERCLPNHYKNVPLKDVRFSSRKMIEKHLNNPENCTMDCDSGLICNYVGLAELVGFSYEQIRHISSKENPTSALFDLWEQTSDLEPTLGKLWEYLIELKRFDAMTDCKRSIGKIRNYSKCNLCYNKIPTTIT